MAATPTSFALNWLNRWYMKLDRVHAASIKGSPWLKRVRFENTGGETVAQPFTLYGHRGDSGDLATAQGISANQKASRKLRWLVPYGTIEGSVRVPHRDIALSRKDKDASARALQFDTDLALKQRGANIVRLWFANPGYSLVGAARAFNAGTSVISGLTAQEASNFIPGDQVTISTASGNTSTDVLVPGSGVGYVLSRDLRALTVTVGNVPNPTVAGTPTNWTTASFFYFRQGEFLPSSSGAIDMIAPLQAYLPPAPVTSTLFNVDRSIDSILSGFQPADASITGKSISARIKRCVNEHREQLGYMSDDSELDCAYMNPIDWGKCEEELTTHLSRTPAKTAEDGYQYLEIQTANGVMMLISEPQCPRGVIFLLSQDDIVWHTPTGTVAEMVDQDGSIVSRMANSNDLELRPVSYIAAKMSAPFKHCRLSATV
jgi:hypothetical protein